MKRWLACTALLAAVATSNVAGAQHIGTERYHVKPGDTLEILAAEYYGNREHKIYIMVENGLDHARPLKPGERLRIPRSEEITAAPGDTLAGLAGEYLGDARRAAYLAEFNQLAADASVAGGQSLRVPLRVTYRANGEEKLRDIALSLFGDASKASLLKNYNFLETNVLNAGDTIVVPIFAVEVQASKRAPRDAESAARIAKRAAMTARAQAAVPQARAAWKDGDFAAVKRELIKIDADYLDTDLAVEVLVLLGATYVAFDDDDSALARFAKVRERKPDYLLSDYDHSPKVHAVWQRMVSGRDDDE